MRAKKRVKAIKGFYTHLTVYLIVNAFLMVSHALSYGGWKIFWEMQSYYTALFWGIGLAIHGFRVFGVAILFGKNWEERKIQELMRKDKENNW